VRDLDPVTGHLALLWGVARHGWPWCMPPSRPWTA